MRVLVTGASRGIGRATALHAAAAGHDVALHFHRHASEAASAVRIAGENGVDAFSIRADLGAATGVRAVATKLRRRWDSLDGLVLNAGVYPRGAFEELTDAQWKACLDLNLLGPVRLARELLPELRRSSAPSVVFVSSVLAFAGSSHGAHYATAKAGLEGLMFSLARELAPQVRVNAVAPGSIDTAILAGDSPHRRAERSRAIPLGRIGRPEEVAGPILFLLGTAASYVTGSTIHVNGGLRTS